MQSLSMKLLVIAYPELASQDVEKIRSCRKVHDQPFYKIVAPHFTLVFPMENFTPEDFNKEVEMRISGSKPISFAIRCATVNKNAFNELYHTFLVPDEGYSDVVKLHDKLYGGKFSNHLRLDLGFVPHIGISNSPDKSVCKAIADEWNLADFEIKGRITELDMVRFDGNKVTTIQKVKF